MKNSKIINSLTLAGIMLSSSLAVVLSNTSNEATVSRASKKEVVHEVLSAAPMTYAQVGTANDGTDRLRFATPVRNFNEDSVLTYTRKVAVAEDKQVTVKSVYKSIAGEGETAYYYDGSELVTVNPENDYYWANYVVKFAKDSAVKSEMFTVVLDVDGTKAPFLTTSYDAIAVGNSPVATFVDAEGTLLGRSIVLSGEVAPLFEGEAPEVEGQEFVGWSDGM